MISKIPYLINRILAKSEIILKSSTPPNATEKGLYDDIIELESLLELTNLPNELLPKVNNEYQCEHIKEKIIRSNCVWCNLTVAEKIIDRLKRELTNLKSLDAEKIKDSLMYDFPKWYINGEITAFQTGIEKFAKELSHFSKPQIKYPEKKEGVVALLDKEGKRYYKNEDLPKAFWNECIDDMRKLNGEGV